MTSPSVETYKEAVGRFATGVVVVTAQTQDGPVGFTCQTFGSLSLIPLLITFAAAVDGQSWSRVRAHGWVGLNILAEDQLGEARRFATSGADRFGRGEWTSGPSGSPLLVGAIAHVEGPIVAVSTHGDHDVAVVRVDYVASFPGRPLVFYQGDFGGLA